MLMFFIFVFVYNSNDLEYQKYLKQEEKHVNFADVYIYNDSFQENVTLPTSIPSQKEFKIDVDLSKYENYGHVKTILTKVWYVNFYIYAGEEKLYESVVSKDSLTRSGGYRIIDFDVPKKHENSVLTLVYERTLDLDINEISMIYLGSKASILKERISDEFPIVVLNLLFLFLFVLILIVFVMNNIFFRKMENTFLHLALMGMILCLYILPQMISFDYLLKEHYLLACFIEFSSLILMPLPVCLIVKDRLDVKFNRLFNYFIMFLIISLFVQTAFTLLKILEYREALPFTQISIIFSMIAVVVLILITDGKKYPAKKELLLTIVPIILSVGIALGYYMLYGVVIFKELIGFFGLVFMFVQGRTAINNIVNYQKDKIKNETYKFIAFTDSLTNLPNRAAHNQFLKEFQNKTCESVWVLSIDLDNLKITNDKYGHNKGDKMLMLFSDVVSEFLNDYENGKIFRVGGDEFIVYLKEDKDFNVTEWINTLQDRLEDLSVDEDVKGIFFSVGACYCDQKRYDNLEDCLIFADQKMYKEKNERKRMR